MPVAAACDVLNGTRHHLSSENRTSRHNLYIEKSAPALRPEVFRIRLISWSLHSYARESAIGRMKLTLTVGVEAPTLSIGAMAKPNYRRAFTAFDSRRRTK
jgi:hypothetical protein